MQKLSTTQLGRVDATTFKEQTKIPIILVLDNIRSALNVGSAFRTADSFALEAIYLCGITATPPHREILKTALGATETVTWTHFETIGEALADLKEKKYYIAAIEQTDKSVFLSDIQIDATQKYALVFGNEVEGVSDEALQGSDICIEIPQWGTKHSLNVSVCIGIVSWEFAKKLVV
jgi:23S rRNA (guanosine2251-2'-O)-methyltransferase